MASRQERQIVQSTLNLDDSLPGFTPSGRLADKHEVGVYKYDGVDAPSRRHRDVPRWC